MTITQAPLEKQIVNIDLSKGTDERQRPELMGGLTRVDNLVQDQSGAWVKRNGVALGPSVDETAYYPLAVKKVLSFINGWGCIGSSGSLFHKQDFSNTLKTRQKHMDFGAVSASLVASTGSAAFSSTDAPAQCFASSSTHDCVVYSQLNSQSLTIKERSSGAAVTYDVGKDFFGTAGGRFFCAIVGDRYLHLYGRAGTGTIYMAQIDLAALLPTESALIASIITASGGNCVIYDCCAGASFSYLLFATPGITSVLQTSTALAVTTAVHAAGGAEFFYSMSLNETLGDLWLVTKDVANSKVKAISSSAVGTTTVAQFASGVAANFIVVDATGAGLLVGQVTTTIGSVSVDSVLVHTKSAANAIASVGYCYGWSPAAIPFFCPATSKFYMHATKHDVSGALSHNVVIDLSSFTPLNSNASMLVGPAGSFRVACNLEPYVGTREFITTGGNGPVYPRLSMISDVDVVAMVPIQTSQRAAAFAFIRLRVAFAGAYGNANFSGSTYIAHGGLNQYDGTTLYEQGFVDLPIFSAVPAAGAGGLLSGSYRYVAVYRQVDASGSSSYSRTFGPVSTVNVAGAVTGRNNVNIQPLGLSNRPSGTTPAVAGVGQSTSLPFVELYRTRSGGTQYYLCATSQASPSLPLGQLIGDPSSGLLLVNDNMSDAVLATQAIMYRQPGTTNAPADRYTAPSASIVIQHKDRLFCVDPYGQRVYYSSFFVDGEAAWFNPAFNFFIHDGAGPITGLASMDGRLFVFKSDAVFVVDGDGPGEAGPTGSEFSPPTRLAARFGCLDHRSVVSTPMGIIYRSRRGIEMVDRSLKFTWLGERVQNTVSAHPVTTGAFLDSLGRVHITLSQTELTNGVNNSPGCEVTYDTSSDAWSVMRFTNSTGPANNSSQQGGAVVIDAGVEKLAYGDPQLGVLLETIGTSADYIAAYVPATIETGWIKQGPQSRQRCSDLMMLAKKRAGSNHQVRLSIAYDYSDTYTQTKTWTAAQLAALPLEELELQPQQQQVLAIRFKIEDLESDDLTGFPTGTGKGSDFLAISAEVAPKIGVPKLATGQKG